MGAFRSLQFPRNRLCILFALLLAVNISPSTLENLSWNSRELFPAGETLVYEVQWEPPPWMFFIPLKNEELTDVPECVQDVLSAIYFARLQELKPELQFPITIGDDGRIREIQVKVLKAEPVDVLGRKNAALKLEAKSVFGGLFKESGTFYVWVSDDAHKMPLQFEAKIKVGKVSGSLKQIK